MGSPRLAVVLLAVTAALWLGVALYQYRVTSFFHAFLIRRFPGPWVVFGAMMVCPALAAVTALRRRRAGWRAPWTRVVAVLGVAFVLVFVALIGLPMAVAAIRPDTQDNPSTPRPLEQLSGLPVFPGAEGFGTDTPAGRGGKLIEVTSLADKGPGSLRAALENPNPRTIVFRVAGTIELEDHLYISSPFVTVAGQTAPGGGICLKDFGLVITSHDVLVQHIRIRPGNEGRQDADTNDAIQVLGGQGDPTGAHHIVIDHVSASWSEDEAVSTWFGAHDVTISWSVISEALNRSRHRKETHSAGLLVGDGSYNVTMHHNLLAHNDFRNPLISEGGTHDFVNNVVYDWGILPTEVYDEQSNSFLNFMGNVFLRGPSTESLAGEILIDPAGGIPSLFVEGNVSSTRPGPETGEWALVTYGWDGSTAPERYRSAIRFPAPDVTVSPAESALETVLSWAGATLPRRDPVDQRVVADVKGRSGRIIDSPAEVGGYPELAAGTAPSDMDRDGMPDEWEIEHGLIESDPADGNADRDGDGYTNIEEYLHSLTERDR
jgi:pectate lyase